jgi:hypothetical protein
VTNAPLTIEQQIAAFDANRANELRELELLKGPRTDGYHETFLDALREGIAAGVFNYNPLSGGLSLSPAIAGKSIAQQKRETGRLLAKWRGRHNV